jgi:hypothetical protein
MQLRKYNNPESRWLYRPDLKRTRLEEEARYGRTDGIDVDLTERTPLAGEAPAAAGSATDGEASTSEQAGAAPTAEPVAPAQTAGADDESAATQETGDTTDAAQQSAEPASAGATEPPPAAT